MQFNFLLVQVEYTGQYNKQSDCLAGIFSA